MYIYTGSKYYNRNVFQLKYSLIQRPKQKEFCLQFLVLLDRQNYFFQAVHWFCKWDIVHLLSHICSKHEKILFLSESENSYFIWGNQFTRCRGTIQGLISQRVRTSPNLGLVLGDTNNVWLVLLPWFWPWCPQPTSDFPMEVPFAK